MIRSRAAWNHNIHYHRVVLDAIPDSAQRALDVGYGEGTLARQLRARVPHVTAIDTDPPSIEIARVHDPARTIDYRLADFMTYPFAADSFDVIMMVATLHHLDARAALARMRDLLSPPGLLVVVGLARPGLPADLSIILASTVATRFHHLTKNLWQHPSPTVWPPPGRP